MPSFSLSTYIIKLRDDEGEYPQLGNVYGADFRETFLEYLDDRKKDGAVDLNSQKMLHVGHFDASGSRTVSGVIETGPFGYEADLTDIDSRAVSYRRTVNDAELRPFYFLAYLPRKRKSGILVTQRTSQYGVRTVLHKDLSEYLKDSNPDITVVIEPLVPLQALEEFLKGGRITKIKFIKYEPPPDLAQQFSNQDVGLIGEARRAELVLSVGRGGQFSLTDKLQALIGSGGGSGVAQLRQDDERDAVKVEFNMGGRKRTIDLLDKKMRPQYDITDLVSLGSDGHPSLDDIHRVASDLVRDLSEIVG